jgi:hypothetical protein
MNERMIDKGCYFLSLKQSNPKIKNQFLHLVDELLEINLTLIIESLKTNLDPDMVTGRLHTGKSKIEFVEIVLVGVDLRDLRNWIYGNWPDGSQIWNMRMSFLEKFEPVGYIKTSGRKEIQKWAI